MSQIIDFLTGVTLGVTEGIRIAWQAMFGFVAGAADSHPALAAVAAGLLLAAPAVHAIRGHHRQAK